MIPSIMIVSSDSMWAYKVIAYEDSTKIEYYENFNGIDFKNDTLKGEDHYTTFDNFDEQLAKAILNVRKQYKELNNGK